MKDHPDRITREDKQLYPSQVEAHQTLYSFWAALDSTFGLVSPTGSGKSTVVSSLVARLEDESASGRRGCKSVFVIVPQTHIQDSFRAQGKLKIKGEGTYSMGPKCWLPARSTTTDRLASMMSARGRSTWFAATSCYPTVMNALEVALEKGDLSLHKRLLVVDEAHHAGEDATQLHKLTKRWVELGGRVLLATATPYRNDGRAVFKPDQPQYIRTIAEHALDVDNQGRPLAPTRMQMCAVRLGGYKVQTKKELDGIACPTTITGHATLALSNRWVEDGKPKLVIVVPQYGSKEWAEKLEKRFKKLGAKVLNAVGTGKDTQEELRGCLGREEKVTRWKDSEVDVILACKRFDEGTNWVLCSHIYVVGFPRSLPQTVQRWGRTFRPKHEIKGHKHPEDGSIVFFCPDPSGIDSEDTMHLHKQAALLTACHLHDYQTARQYSKRVGVFREVKEAIRIQYDLNTVRRLAGSITPTEQDRALAQKAIQEIATKEPELAVPMAARRLSERFKTKKLTSLQYLAALTHLFEGISEKDFSAKEARALRYALTQAFGKKQTARSPKASGSINLVTKSLLVAFNEVLDAYPDIKVQVNEGILEMTGLFTGRTAQQVGKELKMRLGLSMEDAHAEISEFFQREGTRPTTAHLPRLASWLRKRHTTVARECNEIGLPGGHDFQRTLEKARKQIQDFFEEHGRRPKCQEMSTLARWVDKQGTTFGQLCDEMGLPGGMHNRTRTKASVMKELQGFFDEHGRRPYASEKASLYQWLLRHEEMTLNAFCDEMSMLGGPSPGRTPESAQQEVQEFFDRTGARPAKREVANLAAWLRRNGTSLVELCDQMNLPKRKKAA